MKTAAIKIARAVAVLALSGFVALVAGCGGAPGTEEVGASEEAYTSYPEGTCILKAGQDYYGIARGANVLPGSLYSGTDQRVLNFQGAIRGLGGHGAWSVSPLSPPYFIAQDVGGLLWSDVDAVVNQPQNQGAPVYAGRFVCTYNWADWVGTRRPYMPTNIVVYDPRGCSSCM